MKVYLSGPMSGHPEYNIPKFKQVTERLRELGFEVKAPHEVCAHIPQESHPTEFMPPNIIALVECDAIFQMEGWQLSRGCRAEAAVAIITGKSFWCAEQFRPIMPPEEVVVNPYPGTYDGSKG